MGVVYDVLASFTCPRTITFVDYRLGFTHKAIVVAIFAYVFSTSSTGSSTWSTPCPSA